MPSALALAGLIAVAGFTLPPVEREKLPNGLTVLLSPDQAAKDVTVTAVYGMGAADEPPGRSGLGRLFLPLVTYRAGVQKRLKEAGGSMPAMNCPESLFFEDRVPPAKLALALSIESERSRSFGDPVKQSRLDRYRKDVLSAAQRGPVPPSATHRTFVLTYGAGHPYSNAGIGDPQDIEAATVEDVQAFGRKLSLGNAVLVVSGNFDPAEARRLIRGSFGSLEAAPVADRAQIWPPVLTAVVRESSEERATETPRIDLIWPGRLQLFTQETAVASAVAKALESPLRQALVVRRHVATAVQAETASGADGGRVWITLHGLPGGGVETLRQAAVEELARLRSEGLASEDVAHGAAQVAKSYRDSFLGTGRPYELALLELTGHDARLLAQTLKMFQEVTPEAAGRFLREWLPADRYIELVTARKSAKN